MLNEDAGVPVPFSHVEGVGDLSKLFREFKHLTHKCDGSGLEACVEGEDGEPSLSQRYFFHSKVIFGSLFPFLFQKN